MTAPVTLCDLTGSALIRASGKDAGTFLQGQLANDVDLAGRGNAQLTCFNSPKGRALAVMELACLDDAYYLRLPVSIADDVMRRLSMYVLRADVSLENVTDRRLILGLVGDDIGRDAASVMHDAGISQLAGEESCHVLPPLHGRRVILASAASTVRPDRCSPETVWRLAGVRNGLPQVYPATTGQFVPQMLNLDVLGGVSFAKGCYTGQEVIARTQNLGRIKRRMFRFLAENLTGCAAGDPVCDESDATVGHVVRAEPVPGGMELLATARVAAVRENLRVMTPEPAPLARLDLPYDLPSDG